MNRDGFEESLFRSNFLAVEVNGEGVGGVVVAHRGAGIGVSGSLLDVA